MNKQTTKENRHKNKNQNKNKRTNEEEFISVNVKSRGKKK